jgi:hypothetical protein
VMIARLSTCKKSMPYVIRYVSFILGISLWDILIFKIKNKIYFLNPNLNFETKAPIINLCLKFGVSRDPSQKEFQNEVLHLNAIQKN